MIDIKRLEKEDVDPELGRSYRDYYKECLKNRNADPGLVELALRFNQKRKELTTKFDQARAEQNRVGKEIAEKKKKKENAEDLLREMTALSASIKEMDQELGRTDKELEAVLLVMPNCCHTSVPVGSGDSANKEIRQWGKKPGFSFQPKEHDELGISRGLLDFDRAGKVSGARFAFLLGGAARLERALIQFMMDLHSQEHGYKETIPPFIVNSASMVGTNQFPKFVEDSFHLQGTDYHLVPTAEVPVTNFFSGEILNGEDLPVKFCAYSPCFRSEAGSHGRDTKGLIRQHQFNKVELVKFALPESSYEEHEKLTQDAERILRELGLHYRVVSLSTGEIGFGAARCYDIEVWLPGQNQYREISSCSNFEDFQARRANIRFRFGKDKPRFVHTLNGSGLAIGRTLIAIFENGQREDGTIAIPEALHPYMGGMSVI